MTSPSEQATPRPGPTRRTFLTGTGAALGALALPGATGVATAAPVARAPRLTHGVVTGDVTATSAQVWTRGSGPGRAQIVYADAAAGSLTVDLRDEAGASIYSVVIPGQLGRPPPAGT